MKSSQFTVDHIIQIFAEAKFHGQAIAELSRLYGISSNDSVNWRAKYENKLAEEAKCLKALEAENTMLKRLLAEKELKFTFAKNL